MWPAPRGTADRSVPAPSSTRASSRTVRGCRRPARPRSRGRDRRGRSASRTAARTRGARSRARGTGGRTRTSGWSYRRSTAGEGSRGRGARWDRSADRRSSPCRAPESGHRDRSRRSRAGARSGSPPRAPRASVMPAAPAPMTQTSAASVVSGDDVVRVEQHGLSDPGRRRRPRGLPPARAASPARSPPAPRGSRG